MALHSSQSAEARSNMLLVSEGSVCAGYIILITCTTASGCWKWGKESLIQPSSWPSLDGDAGVCAARINKF